MCPPYIPLAQPLHYAIAIHHSSLQQPSSTTSTRTTYPANITSKPQKPTDWKNKPQKPADDKKNKSQKVTKKGANKAVSSNGPCLLITVV